MGQIIAVCGNLGSGKTTLARGIAEVNGWLYLPKEGYSDSYLEDLFSDPKRWSFEAQMCFLGHKADAIRAAMRSSGPSVIDRSIEEDILIFARYFYIQGLMSLRAFDVYLDYAQHLLDELDPPVAVVYRNTPPEECEKRLRERPRPYQNLYPPRHIPLLHQLYEDWWRDVRADIKVVVEDGDTDFRKQENLEGFAATLAEKLEPQASQLILFQPATSPGGDEQRRRTRNASVDTRPALYLAAPFTDAAPPGPPAEDSLFDHEAEHGVLERGPYRDALTKLAKGLSRRGWRVVLPHRDINKWGRRRMTTATLATECLDALAGCDVFVGLVSRSFGSHVEVGYALAAGLPTVVIVCDELGESVFAESLHASGLAAVVRVSRLVDLPTLVATGRLDSAIAAARKVRSEAMERDAAN